ncbi:hypothetical protein, partial [Campylobacter pinnipediorum]|uniref:hypothetical protein n=1 Tax=Campylobacter pinnipediorum TaxID=1965231 RepID=UPI00112F85BE
MKISKIASATIIGAMMTINVYGSSSLDEINSAQKEKSDFIKKLEEASKDGYLDKLKKEKDEIEQQKEQAKNVKIATEKAKQEAILKQKIAQVEKAEAEAKKIATEKAKQEAEKAKQEAEKAKQEAEKAKTSAEQKVEEFFKKDTIKSLNDEINKIKVDSILKDLIKQTTKEDTKHIGTNEIDYIKNKIADEKLQELFQDSDGLKNHEKILILSYLKNMGILKEEVYSQYEHDLQNEDPETTGNEELSKQRMKELAEKFKKIIGEDKTSGLRKLYYIIETINKTNLAEEFNQVADAQKKLQEKKEELINKEDFLHEKQQEIEKQTKQIEKRAREIKDQEQLEKQAQQEIKKQDSIIIEKDELIKQINTTLKQAEKELKQAEELIEAAKDPEVKAKIIAELDAKLNQAKKERAEAISSDKNLELNKDEAQTVLSLLSVTNNEEVNNLLLKTEAEDIAILAKNINSSLEEVSKEFKDNKTVDTLLSSVGSAINSRL